MVSYHQFINEGDSMIRRALLAKLKEALLSVLPVTAIVLLISLTPLVSFSAQEIIIFAASAL